MKSRDLQVGAVLTGPSGQQWRIAGRKESIDGWQRTTISLQGVAPDGTLLKRRLLRGLIDLEMKLASGTWRLIEPGVAPF